MEFQKTRKVIGIKIKKFRKERNLTQCQLAEKCNVEGKYLSYIENGTKIPSLNLLHKISEILEIEIYDLVNNPYQEMCINKLKNLIINKINNYDREQLLTLLRFINK